MPDRCELCFEVSRDDWISLNEILVRTSPEWAAADKAHRRATLRQMLWVGPATVVGASLFIGRRDGTQGMYLEGAAVGLLLAGLMAFGLSRLDTTTKLKKAQLERVRRMDLGTAIGRHTVAMDERGVEISAPTRQLKLSWPAVVVHEVGEYVLFGHGGNDGTLLPKRAFASPAAAAEFVRCGLEWWRQGQLPVEQRIARYLADRDVACPKCGYNLRGVARPSCPECGKELTLEQLETAKQ